MHTDGRYGDETTLRVVSSLFSIEIVIVSTLENGVRVSILPGNSVPIGTTFLGHFAEGKVTSIFAYKQLRMSLTELIQKTRKRI